MGIILFSQSAVGGDVYFDVGKATPYLNVCSLKNNLFESNTVVDFTNDILNKIYHSSEESKKKVVALGANEYFDQLSYQSALGVTQEYELYTLPRCERFAVNLLMKLCPDKASKLSIPISGATCEKAKRYF
ncbi:hypothetical protein [Pseudoalteromonas sp. S558]|jgi:hypothetical protein|uniref:hypothetical protein n=1 Tax=Pseudoalteromonas sp. S558 TaxID=2066515 RepID=UPI00110A4D63|nr:hypothetical protein [Pseudoalteromonas sp. S558]TMN96241.1 hypothetical protein CWB66_17875 [Pseudoalteromonas sp. S558]